MSLKLLLSVKLTRSFSSLRGRGKMPTFSFSDLKFVPISRSHLKESERSLMILTTDLDYNVVDKRSH